MYVYISTLSDLNKAKRFKNMYYNKSLTFLRHKIGQMTFTFITMCKDDNDSVRLGTAAFFATIV